MMSNRTTFRVLESVLIGLVAIAIGFMFLPDLDGRASNRLTPSVVYVSAHGVENEKVSGELQITNGLGLDLEELRISPSCSCTVATLPKGLFKKTESRTIPFVVDLTGRSSEFSVVVALEYRVGKDWFGELFEVVVVFPEIEHE